MSCPCGKPLMNPKAKICEDCWLKRNPDYEEKMKEQNKVLDTIARMARK